MWTKRINPDRLGSELAFVFQKSTLCEREAKRVIIKEMSDEYYYPWRKAKIKRRTRYPNKYPPLR